MRTLRIDDKARAKIARLVEHAKNHPYRLGDPVPGDNPDFVVHLDTYRCVFTFTVADAPDDDFIFRHLSISVPAEGKYPHPMAAFTIATLFGFTGWDGITEAMPDSWAGGPYEEDGCVILAQPLEEARTLN
jgi:hypothetical protein